MNKVTILRSALGTALISNFALSKVGRCMPMLKDDILKHQPRSLILIIGSQAIRKEHHDDQSKSQYLRSRTDFTDHVYEQMNLESLILLTARTVPMPV